MNKLDNSINLNLYKPLSKSKQNTNYLNRTFYYPKSSIKTKNNNFGINSTFCEAQNSKKLNIKKKNDLTNDNNLESNSIYSPASMTEMLGIEKKYKYYFNKRNISNNPNEN